MKYVLNTRIGGNIVTFEMTEQQMYDVYKIVLDEEARKQIEYRIEDALEDGKITQEQADELRDDETMSDMVEEFNDYMESDGERMNEIADDIIRRYV